MLLDCADPECAASSDCSSAMEQCSNMVDDDRNGLTDCDDPACASAPECAPPAEDCANMLDDDGNGLTDCDDPACSADPACAVPACGDDLAEAGEYCFAAGVTFNAPLGSTITLMAAADFNADGARDIVVASASPANVMVLMNSGGMFTPGPVFNTGGTYSALAIADLDQDMRPDLVVANLGNSTVRGLSVATSGAISNMPGFTATVTQPRAIALADLNQDMRPDLIVGNDSQLIAFRNNGSFLQTSTAPFPGPLADLVSSDFDADGRVDVAVVRSGGTEVRLFESDTAGVLLPGINTPISIPSVSVLAVGDADQDTDPDIVMASSVGQGGTLLNNMGGFAPLVSFPLAPLQRLVVADLNFDGRVDLLGGGTTRYVTALSAGTGAFNLAEEIPGGGTFTTVLATDVSGDGFADIIVSRTGAVEVRASNP